MSHVGIEPKLLKKHIGRKETEQAVKVIHRKHGNRCGRPTRQAIPSSTTLFFGALPGKAATFLVRCLVLWDATVVTDGGATITGTQAHTKLRT